MRRILAVAILTAFGGAAYGLESIISFKATGPHVSTAADDSAWRVRLADLRWVGRAVYSSDGAYLGDVAALNEDDHSEIYVSIAGFLALGETTILILARELQHVRDDGIVVRLTEAEVRRLPPAESSGEQL